jgi:hypothetical protein
MKRKPSSPPYRPRPTEPLAVPATAERLSILEAAGVVGREITKDEQRIAVHLAHFFSGQLADLEARNAELQADIIHLRRLVG